MSVVGVVAATLALASLVGGGLVLDAGARARRAGAPVDTLEALRTAASTALIIVPGILLLLAMILLIVGEQFRRGEWGPNPAPPDTRLPTATNVSRFRLLPLGWHVLWVALGAIVCIALVAIPALSYVTGAWPHASTSGDDFTGGWIIYGALGFGMTCAGIASVIKKTTWLSTVARHPERLQGGSGRAFWRVVDYRWRFDLWATGIGGTLVAFSVTALPPVLAGEAGSGALLAALVASGVVLIVLGVLAATQFWRAGESLGSGESLS
ncbi:hypothetical protein [Pseudolysinimonas sp.]|uniref:hypothetical protein n=1 Tax=Pseudolysinimonas sp. TaxID=2680009 RepID=UPI003F7CEB42